MTGPVPHRLEIRSTLHYTQAQYLTDHSAVNSCIQLWRLVNFSDSEQTHHPSPTDQDNIEENKRYTFIERQVTPLLTAISMIELQNSEEEVSEDEDSETDNNRTKRATICSETDNKRTKRATICL